MERQNEASSSSDNYIPLDLEIDYSDEEEIAPEPEQNEEEKKNLFIDEENLRKKIRMIQQDPSLSPKEKAKNIQTLMSHGSGQTSVSQDSEEDSYSKSYFEEGKLGCRHYQRNCKLQANCCQKLVSCRFCHDDKENHTIVRHDTKNMLCMLCLKLQPANKDCMYCKESMAFYYCDKCKLWDNDSEKLIYHCDDCGICRKGKGLGKDFFHCKKCNICMSIRMEKHKCIERNLECDCPICGEYLFTSTLPVIFMPCGHCIHQQCYSKHVQTSYQCPTCLKSLSNMSRYFTRLDRELERQPMPPEYEKFISHIFCNDCEKRTTAKYHFFYHKCGNCSSFNTTVLKTENTGENTTTTTAIETGEPSNRLVQVSSNEAIGLSAADTDYLNQTVNTPVRNPATGGQSSSRTEPDSNER